MAYGMTWLLLLSGVREATKHGTKAGDAVILKRMTHLPRWLWALLWVAGTFGAVYIGWRLLAPIFAAGSYPLADWMAIRPQGDCVCLCAGILCDGSAAGGMRWGR